MKSLRLIFGTYNQQPEGNLPELFERAYQNAYKPFLSLLYNHPRLPVVLYYCGSLYEWLEEHHPEFLMLLREMVRRKQVELLGGGFYSPILSLLPDGDKLGQIEKLTTYLRTTFGVRPRGGWLVERVWEPALARILRSSGLEYTFLDDRHFHLAGIKPQDSWSAFLAEEQGKTLSVLPIWSAQADRIPFCQPPELLESLRELARDQEGRVAVLLLEGEKLGDRDGTQEICYKQNWLKSFFQLLEDNREWLLPLSPRLEETALAPSGRVYFPCLASGNIMKWALDTERQRSFQEAAKRLRRPDADVYLPGGYFRHFLTKYPEANLLYSRLLYTHLLVNQMRGDKSRKKSALEDLWRGEVGAVYWHGDGPGGGIFDARLRQGSYRAFIEAEKLSRSGRSFLPSLIATDFDMDGRPEYLYQGKTMNALLHLKGGGILELDYLPAPWNYLGTMARWPQPYHRFKYEGCDWYMRRSFLDHFFAPETLIEAFDRMSYPELGDFLNQDYEVAHLRREHEDITLSRSGRLRIRRRDYPLTVQKRFQFKEGAIECGLLLRNGGSARLDLWYGLELNLALPSKEQTRIAAQKGSQKRELGCERTETDKVEGVTVRDLANSVAVSLETPSPFLLWSLPVETVSYPPGGRVRHYQSSCLVLSWKFPLSPGEQWEGKVTLKLAAE